MANISRLIGLIAMLFVAAAGAAKVLLTAYPHPSHVMMTQAIGEDLIERGHEVFFTFESHYQIPESIRNGNIQSLFYRCQTTVPNYREELMGVIFDNSTKTESSVHTVVSFGHCECMMSDRTFLDQVKSIRFDFMVIDFFPNSCCYTILPVHLGVPYALSTAVDIPLMFRIPALPSFYEVLKPGSKIPSLLSLETLYERLSNVFYTAVMHLVYIPVAWKNTSLLERYGTTISEESGRKSSVTSWEEATLRSELVLLQNDYHLLDSAVALPPYVVAVPGCTARPAESLPVVIQNVFGEPSVSTNNGVVANTGVVLMSFGSFVDYLPPEITAKIIGALARLREKVIVRMSPSNNIEVPKNVHLLPWLPQSDILGQIDTVLFITHCGNNGLYEALYHGVPVLGVPLFAEQGWNCAQVEHRGLGRCLSLSDLTADNLYIHIRELIDNSTYRLTVQKQSEIWRSQPLIGRRKAGFWVDHVIKYGGQHLRSRAVETTLYEFLMLDIILLGNLVVYGFSLIGYCLISRLLRKISKRVKKNVKAE